MYVCIYFCIHIRIYTCKYAYIYLCVYTYVNMYIFFLLFLKSQLYTHFTLCREGSNGWLQLIGSLKLQVSFAEYSLFYRALLQKRPIYKMSSTFIWSLCKMNIELSIQYSEFKSHTHTHTHTHIGVNQIREISILLALCVCVYVCACV